MNRSVGAPLPNLNEGTQGHGDTLTSMLLGLRHFVSPFAVRFVRNYDDRPVAHWEIDLAIAAMGPESENPFLAK